MSNKKTGSSPTAVQVIPVGISLLSSTLLTEPGSALMPTNTGNSNGVYLA